MENASRVLLKDSPYAKIMKLFCCLVVALLFCHSHSDLPNPLGMSVAYGMGIGPRVRFSGGRAICPILVPQGCYPSPGRLCHRWNCPHMVGLLRFFVLSHWVIYYPYARTDFLNYSGSVVSLDIYGGSLPLLPRSSRRSQLSLHCVSWCLRVRFRVQLSSAQILWAVFKWTLLHYWVFQCMT